MAKYTSECSFDIDTKELHANGQEYNKLCSAIIEDLTDLFLKLENVKSTCWIGESAEAFVLNVKHEQIIYMNFCNAMKAYGKCLCDIAEEYENFEAKVGVE